MALEYLQTAVTPAVQAAQRHYYGRVQTLPPANDAARTSLGPEEAAFIAARDSFYLATVSETGWPYLQHRGGPLGFLRVLDAYMLAFADFKGNRQLLSTGNLAGGNDRAALFLMDYYPARTRLKLSGHLRVIDARQKPELARQVAPDAALLARTERVFVVDVVSFVWNCPQYITPRPHAGGDRERRGGPSARASPNWKRGWPPQLLLPFGTRSTDHEWLLTLWILPPINDRTTMKPPAAFLLTALALLSLAPPPLTGRADEGMWLFNAPPAAQFKGRYGFEPSAEWLNHLQKSSVRFFSDGGSGSFVSGDGLIITNQHIGANTLQQISDETHNYLRDGFYAATREEEKRCPDMEVNVLMSTEEVTTRINAAVTREGFTRLLGKAPSGAAGTDLNAEEAVGA